MLEVLGRARRRGIHVLRALEVGLLEPGLVDEQVLGARLAPGPPPTRPRDRDRLNRLLAGDVDDVQRAARDVRELYRAVRGLGLGLGRTRGRVPARLRLALRERLLDDHVDRV